MKIKDTELQSILAEVEAEIGALLKSEATKLAKAKADEESAETEVPAAETSPEAPAANAPEGVPPGETSAAEAPGIETSPETNPEASAEASAPAGDETQGDDQIDGDADPQALQAEYAKLTPEQLKNHYLACKAALFALMGGEGSAPADAQMPAPEAAPPAPAMKSEAQEQTLVKNDEIALLKAQLENQSQILEKLNTLLATPSRKAVTGVSYMAKAEAPAREWTRGEAISRLTEITREPGLKKADREAINAFCCNEVGLDKIAHLLK